MYVYPFCSHTVHCNVIIRASQFSSIPSHYTKPIGRVSTLAAADAEGAELLSLTVLSGAP